MEGEEGRGKGGRGRKGGGGGGGGGGGREGERRGGREGEEGSCHNIIIDEYRAKGTCKSASMQRLQSPKSIDKGSNNGRFIHV